MIAHEVAGVAIGVLFLAAFVVAVKPGSTFGNILSQGVGSYAGLVGVATGQTANFGNGISVGG